MNMHEWNHYLYELQQLTQKQEKKMKELEDKITRLDKQIQGKSKNTIEKIEYHFEQLRIDKLDGTLHIGLSPSDIANFDEWSIPPNNQPIYPPAKQAIVSGLSKYLHEAGPQMIRSLSEEYNRPIDPEYMAVLLQDIEKQLPQRVTFYETEAKRNRNVKTEQEVQHYVTEQIKNEMYHSLTKYMQTNEQKGAEQ